MPDLICNHCSSTFFRSAGEHAKSLRKGKTRFYCSRKCADAARAVGDTKIDLVCDSCRRPFKRVLAEHRRNQNYGMQQAFCSAACSDKGRTLALIGKITKATFSKERRAFESGSTLAERIESYGERMPNGCLEWQGTYTGAGRPILKVGDNNELVARLVWIQHKGPIPVGKIIRHVVCRNKRCIDILHLDTGTHLDNAADRERDGMTARGEAHGMAKLSDRQVQEILASTDSLRELADRYKVSKSQIQRIVTGENRKTVP